MSATSPPTSAVSSAARILLVDDDLEILAFYEAALRRGGYGIERAVNGAEAVEKVRSMSIDLVVSDIDMPEMDGLQLLRAIRDSDLDVPVILVTGGPSITTAIKAVEYGALRYLTKPVEPGTLREVVEYGVVMSRLARTKREARRIVVAAGGEAGDRAGLEASFEKALSSLWMAFQPIVSWSTRSIYGYEALVRTDEPSLCRPLDLLEAARKLDRRADLARAIRISAASMIGKMPRSASVFVNVDGRDIHDDDLYSLVAPLSMWAKRVVLEFTEREAIGNVADARAAIVRLRSMGYRIALDDLGVGHAGLAAFANLEPDLVKLDLSLTRGVDREPTRRTLVQSMCRACAELKVGLITEGVETPEERDAIAGAGGNLMQGYLFGRPERMIMVPSYG